MAILSVLVRSISVSVASEKIIFMLAEFQISGRRRVYRDKGMAPLGRYADHFEGDPRSASRGPRWLLRLAGRRSTAAQGQ